MNFALTYADA